MLQRLLKSMGQDRQPEPLSPTIGEVLKRSLTYLDTQALNDLFTECRRLEDDAVEGAFVEAGCALGGSAIVIASAKAPARDLKIYDVFGTIPAPSELDGADVHDRYRSIVRGQAEGIGGHRYYGYEDNLLDKVRGHFRSCGIDPEANNVDFIRGLFQDTMHFSGPVAFAHIDGDWYDSVTVSLERIAPNLQRGGLLVIDDYHHWSGCRRAVDDFFSLHSNGYRFETRARLHVRKL